MYDMGKNTGWVSVGVSADTAEFAFHSIPTWWYTMGAPCYDNIMELLITADCGGSNGYRVRLWKYDTEYERNGTASIFMAFEPLEGLEFYFSGRTENEERLGRIH